MRAVIPITGVERAIHAIRGQRVMLDTSLAEMYGVAVRVLNQAVKRHKTRFPVDFAFRLTLHEMADLKSQSVISSVRTHGGARRALPMAFTEQGVAMLSGVLTSPRAVAVNLAIMRAFVQMRRALTANIVFGKQLATLEARMAQQGAELGQHKSETTQALKVVFGALRRLAAQAPEPEPKRHPIGFDLRPRR